MRQTSPFETAGFISTFGAAVTVVGGIILAITKPSETFFSIPWPSVGVGIVVVGVAVMLWGLVVFLSDRRVGQHWCPDPDAHELHGSPMSDGWVRSALYQIRIDARAAIERIEKAIATGKYWGASEYNLEDRTWRKNRKQLAGVAGMTSLLDALTLAYEHVDRIKGFVGLRSLRGGGQVKSDDHLDLALGALLAASQQLDVRMAVLSPESAESPEAPASGARTIAAQNYTELHLEGAVGITLNLPGHDPVSVSSNTVATVDGREAILLPQGTIRRVGAYFGDWPVNAVLQSQEQGWVPRPPEVQRHGLHSVGGTTATCYCGFHADTGPEFEAHLKENDVQAQLPK